MRKFRNLVPFSFGVRFGAETHIEASMPRSGRRSARSRRRSGARRKRCEAGFARPSVARDSAPGPRPEERERIKALEREVRELRQANEILRNASAYFAMAEFDRRSKPSTAAPSIRFRVLARPREPGLQGASSQRPLGRRLRLRRPHGRASSMSPSWSMPSAFGRFPGGIAALTVLGGSSVRGCHARPRPASSSTPSSGRCTLGGGSTAGSFTTATA